MQLIDTYEEDKVFQDILGHFDCRLEDISKKELESVVYKQVKTFLNNEQNLQLSSFKRYSIYQVAMVVMYQELRDSRHLKEENIPALIHISCEFANEYNASGTDSIHENVNMMMVEELYKVKVNEENCGLISTIQERLFKEENALCRQRHVQRALDFKEQFFCHDEPYDRKSFSREQVMTILMLFTKYYDSVSLEKYTEIKKIPDS